MQYTNLGRTGLRVSRLCLGTMQFGWTADQYTSYQILDEAFEYGINFLDTADVYSKWVNGNPGGVSESIIGDWIKQKGVSRDQLVLATKVRGRMGDGPNDEGLSKIHIMSAVESSLKRLKTDYIDLYQAHYFDESTPIEETLETLTNLVRQGKIRYIGCSNYPAWRLMQALWVADKLHLARFDSLQPHYNLVHRAEFERELSEVCRVYGIGILPYSPLGAGFLTGKYRRNSTPPDSARLGGVQRYFTDKNWSLIEKLELLGQQKAGENQPYTVSQIALAWVLSTSWITSPIIGPRTLEQLHDNMGAINIQLTSEEKKILDEASDWINND